MLFYAFATILLAVTQAEDDLTVNLGDLPMQNPDLFEGDILGIENADDRNAHPDLKRRWTNKIIPYELTREVMEQKPLFEEAISEYHKKTCLKFIPRTTERNYIRVYSAKGCYGYVGMLTGSQGLSLGRGCWHKGIIIHELGHTIGFFHEHSRSDRDKYITILWENIMAGMENQFQLLLPSQNILYDNFDYDSIMLYSSTAFSKDKKSYTMVTKSGERLKETREKPGLSASDIYRIKKMYNC